MSVFFSLLKRLLTRRVMVSSGRTRNVQLSEQVPSDRFVLIVGLMVLFLVGLVGLEIVHKGLDGAVERCHIQRYNAGGGHHRWSHLGAKRGVRARRVRRYDKMRGCYVYDIGFSSGVELSERTVKVGEDFGVGLDDRCFMLYDDFELRLKEGDVVYITGDSGSEKSVLLDALRVDLGDQAVVMDELPEPPDVSANDTNSGILTHYRLIDHSYSAIVMYPLCEKRLLRFVLSINPLKPLCYMLIRGLNLPYSI